MDKINYRTIRIGQEIKKSVANILQYDLNDPRIHLNVSILHVVVSKDLSHAKIFFSLLKDSQLKKILKILNHAIGYIRKKLSQKIFCRIIPSLIFIYDDSLLKGIKMTKIINTTLNICENNSKH
ncbi:30S ribosome-binding factor [Buchnera aphidicola (Eriosoma grossulariae)]|uniref:30S ribosome-binding factor RbfA n=1 Tax=Buchnera aphidicola TaxID=9 RepID=UPI003463FEF4